MTQKIAAVGPRRYSENGRETCVSVVNLVLSGMVILLVGGCASLTPPAVNGSLSACPSSPRCVSTEMNTPARQRVAAIPLASLSVTQAHADIVMAIEAMGGKIQSSTEDGAGHYIAAIFSSSLLGFVDDLTCRIDAEAGKIHLRSESRVGFYDLGANRRRVNELRQRLLVVIDGSASDIPVTDSSTSAGA